MEPAEQTVMGIARGYQLSPALYVPAKLGVADVLDPQPLAAEAIARAVGARASARMLAEAEFTQLLDQAGLRPARTTALTAGPHLLEATP